MNTAESELFVQDATAGIFVFIHDSRSSSPLQAGQQVEINGVSAPGDFSSSITKATIRVTGVGALPRPVQFPFDHLLTGEEDCQWGELKGIVRSSRVTKGILYLDAVTTGGAFLVIMKDYPADWPTSLIDAKVTFEGVLAEVFIGVRILIPAPRFTRIDDPAPRSPFDLPQSSATTVGAFRTNVTAVVSGSQVYVSDGEINLAAELIFLVRRSPAIYWI